MVGTVGVVEQSEVALLAGEIPCTDCMGLLRHHWHARKRIARGEGDTRPSVRPQRARCSSCGHTQVLLPAALFVRRANTVEVIGTTLAAKTAGNGHRTISSLLGWPFLTVRRWLR